MKSPGTNILDHLASGGHMNKPNGHLLLDTKFK